MDKIKVCVVSAFTPPTKDAKLVVFHGGNRSFIPNNLEEMMLQEAKRYAKAYNVYLIPELYEKDEKLHSLILSPTGELLGESENAFLNLNHRGRLHRGGGVEVIDTPLGRIALVVDVDVGYPQTVRILQLKKAQLVIALSHIDKMDFYPQMVTYKAIAMAVDSGLPLLWSTSCGTVSLSQTGESITAFSWMLPYETEIQPYSTTSTTEDQTNLKLCKQLLAHTFDRGEEQRVFLQ